MAKKKGSISQRQKRQLRAQQIIFIAIGVIIILAMVLSLFTNV